jgi:cobalamin biosynthesis Mg chelatase CobN
MRKYPIGIILTESEYVELMNEFLELVYKEIVKLGADSFERMLRRKQFENWLYERMDKWFKDLLSANRAEYMIVRWGRCWDWNRIYNGRQFYEFAWDLGLVEDFVTFLKNKLLRIRK